MNFQKVSNLLSNIAPILVTLLSAILTHMCPLSFTIISTDKVYGFSLSLYSATLSIIFKLISNWVQNLDSSIDIVYSLSQSDFPRNEEVFSSFNSEVATVYTKISIKGKAKHLLNTQIKVVFPIQVEIQGMDKYKKYYEVDHKKKTITTNLADAFNFEKEKVIGDSAIIGFKVIKNDEEVGSYIETNVLNKPKNIRVSLNKLKFTK